MLRNYVCFIVSFIYISPTKFSIARFKNTKICHSLLDVIVELNS